MGAVTVVLALGCEQRVNTAFGDRSANEPSVSVAPAASPGVAPEASPYAVDNSMPGVREPHVRRGSAITELLVDSSSAYTAGLVVDDDVVYLLTDKVAHRVVPGSGSSPEQVPLENGSTAAVARKGLVYWSNGSLWIVPRRGGKARRLTVLEHQPQSLMAAGDDIAWLDMKTRDQFLIQTFDGRHVRTLLSYEGRIETATMAAGRVFFVRRDDSSTWRIGSVPVRGGEATYTAPKGGATPARLAVEGNVYYYDLRSNEVRQVSADLSREQTLARDFICSPIAVSVRIYCPNVQGMFELARHPGAKLMPLFPSSARITSVAASSRWLAWLNDAGADRLSLKVIRLELDDEQ